jgi:ABC-type dipeptide/oligopeptide/nickel transport system ATPase component
VGETGCGKSVTGLSLLRLVPPPGEIVDGRITFDGQDVLSLSEQEMRDLRGARISMIFQDPAAFLNPVFTVGEQIELVIRQHQSLTRRVARQRTLEMLEAVGLPDPPQIIQAYPHELSGGMQQWVMIALALASNARLLIADEPTTALDVTIQAQILTLLTQLKESQDLSILLITHNLGVVAETCDRVAVLYVGHVVEQGRTRDIFKEMKHPYTQGLLAAIPRPGSHGQPFASHQRFCAQRPGRLPRLPLRTPLFLCHGGLSPGPSTPGACWGGALRGLLSIQRPEWRIRNWMLKKLSSLNANVLRSSARWN